MENTPNAVSSRAAICTFKSGCLYKFEGFLKPLEIILVRVIALMNARHALHGGNRVILIVNFFIVLSLWRRFMYLAINVFIFEKIV